MYASGQYGTTLHAVAMKTTGLITGSILLMLCLTSCCGANEPTPLAGTELLDWQETDLSDRLMDAAHAFIERKITAAAVKRKEFWKYDFSSRAAYLESVVEPDCRYVDVSFRRHEQDAVLSQQVRCELDELG